jgi:phosphohistidine phosphatase
VELYIIRHADAQPRGEENIQDDAERPLTDEGHRQCAKLAAALQQRGIRLERIVTSSLLRARQTADDLVVKLPSPAPQLHTCDHLAPGGKRRKLTRFLRGLGAQSVAIVGHAPDLDSYVAWLIGSKKAQLELAKAGVACIHFEDEPEGGAGTLLWMVTPQWCS